MNKQKGVSVLGFIFIAIIVALVALLAMKIVPSVTEYFAVQRSLQRIAGDSESGTLSESEVKNSFSRYAQVEYIETVQPEDLKISREGGKAVVTVDYEKRIPLFANVSLVIAYSASSRKK
jgi:hypothetical protein